MAGSDALAGRGAYTDGSAGHQCEAGCGWRRNRSEIHHAGERTVSDARETKSSGGGLAGARLCCAAGYSGAYSEARLSQLHDASLGLRRKLIKRKKFAFHRLFNPSRCVRELLLTSGHRAAAFLRLTFPDKDKSARGGGFRVRA